MAAVWVEDEPGATSSNAVDVETYKNIHLQQIISLASAEQLERGVDTGIKLLETLKAPLIAALGTDTQAAQWLEAIQHLQDKAKPTRTVIGVVGNTGAGKSSVVNAILDEESLIPTNGMRACTGSATEISWNHSDDPARLYRAEVDFIAQDDWATELDNLFRDLLDGNGRISSDSNNPDTEAGLAYAKIKAVYPHQTKTLLTNSSPGQMAQEPAVRKVLGSVKCLAARDAMTLFRELQHYVDSKEKSTAQDTVMEYWPLIKVVRIYCKAPALETGAVIVDLPGVQDSSAARAAVAGSYLQLCTGIWITAAIQRAVDDKAAKKLLGESFKRQLKFDGTYSAVTFICTKTDDILVSEVSRSLGLDQELHEKWRGVGSLHEEQESLKQQVGGLKEEMATIDSQVEELDADADKLEELIARIGDGETVYRPNLKSIKKRKRKSRPCAPRKRQTSVEEISDTASSDDFNASSEENSQPDNGIVKNQDSEERSPQVEKPQKEAASRLKKEVATLSAKEKNLRSEIKSVCVKGRNEYSRAAIKNEFAMGIKELDQEAAMAEDETRFNPDKDVRDYEAVARELPVFCVSARAYQKLSGRLPKDAVQVDGFPSKDDTEVPSLQEHTRRLTEAGRANNCRRFLSDLDQLLSSMKLWAISDAGVLLSKEEQRADEAFVRLHLEVLKKCLHEAVGSCITAFRDTLATKLYKTFERAIPKASAKAVKTATSWGAYGSDTGLHYCTYKATTRRAGVFRHKDFNVELLDPVSRRLSAPWEELFQKAFPSLLDDLAGDCRTAVSQFHSDATSGVRRVAANPVGLMMLQQQLHAAISFVDAAPADLREDISSRQREANRCFTPVIQQAMRNAYDVCAAESGVGSYARMNSAMISHIEDVRHSMFRQACDAVQTKLEQMCDKTEVAMQTLVKKLFMRLKRDYFSVLVQGNLPDSEKKLRALMRKDLVKADHWFVGLDQENAAAFDAPMSDIGRIGMHQVIVARPEGDGDDDDEPIMMDKQAAPKPTGAHEGHREMAPMIKAEPIWQ